MLPCLRPLALAALCALAPGLAVQAADDDLLPPEPSSGEWIQDTLTDDCLWFATAGSLAFEDIAADLAEYPRGRRWVRVVDGQPAWVMYYVPGEILGFEVDTHHLGASATDFRFAVGSTWKELRPVEASYEEITGFEATWMRLYRTSNALPADTRFLRIEFPTGDDATAARLTEVWLRCQIDALPRSPFEPAPEFIIDPAPATGSDAPVPAAAPVIVPEVDVFVVPFVVNAVVLAPPATPAPTPIFGATEVDTTPPAIDVVVPVRLTTVDFLADETPLSPPPGVTLPRRSFLSDLSDLLLRAF